VGGMLGMASTNQHPHYAVNGKAYRPRGLTNIQVVHAPNTKWDMTGAIQCVRLADQASQNRDIWLVSHCTFSLFPIVSSRIFPLRVSKTSSLRDDLRSERQLGLTGSPKAPGIPIGNAISG
jgi:hypothetical protein